MAAADAGADEAQIRLIAFAERPAQDTGGTSLLQVYIVNDSPAVRFILDDLDSINIPQRLPHGNEAVSDAGLLHVDFGVVGSAAFVPVAPGECVQVTLVLRNEELALLERVRQFKATVRFRAGADRAADATSALLQAAVYSVNRQPDR